MRKIFFLIVSVAFGFFLLHVVKNSGVSSHTTVLIPYGSSLKRVARILKENEVIKNENLFYWYVRLGRSDAHKFQAGFYEFNGRYSLEELATRLLFGQDRSYQVTIKEGENLSSIAKSIAEHGFVNEADLLNNAQGFEGYLFPDTYLFGEKEPANLIIERMHKRMMGIIGVEMQERMKAINLSLHQILTLASIIEKETGAAFERPMIASVYLNRLHIGMRLQADPTVIYGIKDFQGRLKKKDLLTLHPYNTYKIKGLPPGPISAPGIDSIKAVLWPAQTKYLYFVSKNDGTHEFCEDLICHNRAVKKWQIDFRISKK